MEMKTDVRLEPQPIVKKWYASKTLWTNFLMGVFTFVGAAIPSIKEHLTPESLAGVFTVVNFILRFVTKSKIQIL